MRIELLTRATGMRGIDEPQHAGFLPQTPTSRDEAIALIEDYTERFDIDGTEKDGWWCRNINDVHDTLLVIRE
jgi:hypothetical protein